MRPTLLAAIVSMLWCSSATAQTTDKDKLRDLLGSKKEVTSNALDRSEPLGADDVNRIVDTYKANQMRFARDYRGRLFSSIMPFRNASETFSKGEYQVGFGIGRFGADVECEVNNPADIRTMSDWNPGDQIRVEGIIAGISFESISLHLCTLVKQ